LIYPNLRRTPITDLDDLQNLLQYHRWANLRVLEALQPLSSEEFTRTLPSSFPSARDTLVHLYRGDFIWQGRVLGDLERKIPDPTDFPTLEQVRVAWVPVLDGWNAALEGKTPDLNIEYATSSGNPFSTRLEDIVRQTVSHASYHRGQIATLMRMLEHGMVATDYILWVREKTA